MRSREAEKKKNRPGNRFEALVRQATKNYEVEFLSGTLQKVQTFSTGCGGNQSNTVVKETMLMGGFRS